MNRDMSFSFFPPCAVADKYFDLMLAEFAANGEKFLTLDSTTLKTILENPVQFILLREKMQKAGLAFRDCHGIWGSIHDLNSDDRQYRPAMIAKHKLAMGYAADAGCLTYTVHIGAQCCYSPFPWKFDELRKLAADALSQLIPEAEKLDIMLCVENSFEPTNSPDEVLALVEQFTSPNLGVCFDSGHANILTSGGKDPALYSNCLKMAWKEKYIFEDHALEKLSSRIVTCHLHDNNGYDDGHDLPGRGTIDWPELISALAKCPALLSMQCEVSALSRGIAVRTLSETFRGLSEYLPA